MDRRLFLALALTGCGGAPFQSALHPAGPPAARIAELWWIMLAVLGGYTLVVFALLALALLRRPAAPPFGATAFVLVGGVAVPAVILFGLLVASLDATRALQAKRAGMRIEVIGHQWWWEVRYPDLGIVTANEIAMPVGDPVQVELRSKDVIHAFWVPSLHGKVDMLPDHPTWINLLADRAGSYRGQCAEFCGAQHTIMAFDVEAVTGSRFAAWAAVRRASPTVPVDPLRVRGRRAFLGRGCAACHTVAGTSPPTTVGPDLSHFGARATLAAGAVPNTPATLAAWIREPRETKPGSLMPATRLDPDELAALVAYLGGLR